MKPLKILAAAAALALLGACSTTPAPTDSAGTLPVYSTGEKLVAVVVVTALGIPGSIESIFAHEKGVPSLYETNGLDPLSAWFCSTPRDPITGACD